MRACVLGQGCSVTPLCDVERGTVVVIAGSEGVFSCSHLLFHVWLPIWFIIVTSASYTPLYSSRLVDMRCSYMRILCLSWMWAFPLKYFLLRLGAQQKEILWVCIFFIF